MPPSVRALRLLSLVCASVSLAALLAAQRLGAARFLAAALLAVYPPAVLLAVDARAYAMCAMFVTLGLVAPTRGRAALAFVAAAYTHYYGALFLPLLLLREPASSPQSRAVPGRDLKPFAAACVAFLPGAYLAFTQPPQATRWLQTPIWTPLTQLSFAADYPTTLFAPAPVALIVVALALFVLAVTRGRNAFALATLLPLALVILLGVVARKAYFPMRFESVLAPPLVLWLATSLHAAPRRLRLGVAGALLLIGVVVLQRGIADHAARPLDPYRRAARIAATTPPDVPVVASGYLYLETVTLRPATLAFPREQAEHPGWRRILPPDQARRELAALPAEEFTWVGERNAPELAALRGSRPIMTLASDPFAVVARIGRRP